MAEFLVKMADERGRVLEQLELGHSEAEVRDRVVQQGYLVYWVRRRGLGAEGALFRRRRIKLDQFVVFNQQFVTLIRAGLPILTALELLSRQQKNSFFKAMLENVRDRIKSGEALSDAFAAQGVLPKIYTTTLLAGERSGNLEEVLNRYIAFQRVTLSFRKKLVASLIYPALLIASVLAMLTFMVTYVVPKFAELYRAIDRPLPLVTTYILSVGEAVQSYLLVIVVALAVLIALLLRWSQTEGGAARLERWRLQVPLLGQVWLKYQVALFSRMMSTLLSGGLPLVTALQTTQQSMESRLIRNALVTAERRVREGMPLARSLEETGIFPELSVEMIEVGESTGALPAMLNSVAEFYEEDVQNALTAALSLIEPVILLVMGVVVVAVLFALYMPIFSLGAGAR